MYLVSKGSGREGHGVTDFGYPMEQHYQGPSNPNIGNDSQQEKRKLPTAGLLLLPYWMPNMRRDKQAEKKQRKHNFFVSLPLIVFTSATLILYFPCSFPVSACHPFWEGMSLSLDLFLFVIAQAQVILSLQQVSPEILLWDRSHARHTELNKSNGLIAGEEGLQSFGPGGLGLLTNHIRQSVRRFNSTKSKSKRLEIDFEESSQESSEEGQKRSPREAKMSSPYQLMEHRFM